LGWGFKSADIDDRNTVAVAVAIEYALKVCAALVKVADSIGVACIDGRAAR